MVNENEVDVTTLLQELVFGIRSSQPVLAVVMLSAVLWSDGISSQSVPDDDSL
jgi:hypothetical protein